MSESLIYYHLLKSGLFNTNTLSGMKLEPLSSGTNHVFLVSSDNRQYVIKIPKDAAQGLIDRKNEYQASQLTAAAGINLPCCYFDLDSGINISVYQPDSRILTPELLQQEPLWQTAAHLLQKLHKLPQKFPCDINIFSVIDFYKQKINGKIPPDLTELLEWDNELKAIRDEFSAMNIPSRPCHNDPILTNFLQTHDQKIYLIDWEYAGNNDPCWDLASLASEAEFSPAHQNQFLTYYFQRTPDNSELRRFRVYKVLANYLWALWCLVMEDLENARRRLQHFKRF